MVHLNDIEMKVVSLMLKGKSANEIGEEMQLDLRVVDRVRKCLYQKLEITNPMMLLSALLRNEINIE